MKGICHNKVLTCVSKHVALFLCFHVSFTSTSVLACTCSTKYFLHNLLHTISGSRIVTDFHFDDQLSFMATHDGVMVTCYDFREITVIMCASTKIFDQFNYMPWYIVQYWSCGCGTTAHCQDALGMESGQIADTDLSASSSFEMGNVGPQNGR